MNTSLIEGCAQEWIIAWFDKKVPAIGPDGDALLDWILPRNNPSICLDVILNVLDRIDIASEKGEKLMGILGAGPLETLLDCHGDNLLDQIRASFNNNEKFRKLFGENVFRDINSEL